MAPLITPVPYNDRAYRWVKDATGSIIVVPSSLGIIGASMPVEGGFGALAAPHPAIPAAPKPHAPLPLRARLHQRQAVGLIDGYRR